MKTSYLPIHPQVLRIDTKIPFDVFVKTGPETYDCLFKTGKIYTAIVHVKVFKFSVPALFIKSEEYPVYLLYIEENAEVIFKDMLISLKSKAKIAHELIADLARLVMKEPDRDSVHRYRKVVTFLADFVFSHEESIQYLITLTSTNFHEYNHSVNVGIYALGLLREIVKKGEVLNLKDIANGFFFHDIGLTKVPEHIRNKNGKLDPEEYDLVKKHPEQGIEILKSLDITGTEMETVILQHHERHDGSGYPKGLKGNQIHTYSKICAIADIFDALTSNRPYRKAQSSFKALQIMQYEMKNEFDPKLFAKFVLLFSKQKQHEAEKVIRKK